MIRYAQGNLLDAQVEALVNTVNTVGVMGKGIALMFKDAFPWNFRTYETACALGEVRIGKMFVVERADFFNPKYIINFPTKKHWRHPSKLEWINAGLKDLKVVIESRGIKSIAIPPLGSGYGGLAWPDVREEIEASLSGLGDVDIIVYEPTKKYQNVVKRNGVETLTPARALVTEAVRQYSAFDIECSILEVQKLAYFLTASIEHLKIRDPLGLEFGPNRYGPYAHPLQHMLDSLDGSFLHCEKRIADSKRLEPIWFENSKLETLSVYLSSTPEAKSCRPALERTAKLIEGFESPLGMELLSTVHWLATRENVALETTALRQGVRHWPGGGKSAAERKDRIFTDRMLAIAAERVSQYV